MSMSGTYSTYHMTLAWPEFIAEGRTGLSFCTHRALSVDEVDTLSLKVSENRHTLMMLKHIQMPSSK